MTGRSAISPTPQQQRAIAARGNVLVVAGAGAGKTQTVVQRCLDWLLDVQHPGSIDQVLMVTFTKAAAAEMRQRLRVELEKAAPPSHHLAEQLALLDTAHICTLHSFCFHLVSRHFYDLGLDPRARILPEERTRLLERRTMDAVLEKIYAGDSPPALAIQQLIQSQGGDWDAPVRELILRLHHYTQTLRDPAGWLAAQTARFSQSEPADWLRWLLDEAANWRRAWLSVLQAQPANNKNAAQCARALADLPERPDRARFAAALENILAADANWPRPKGPFYDPIKNIFDEAEFLRSVCAVGETDPLAEDWRWARPAMLALLDLAGQFERAFQDTKRQEAGLDYHDLEQFALRLLWQDGRRSAIAAPWRKKFRLVFVDEYQDINEAQAAIIEALGRDGAEANRFLVGDVKQSIYGFRLADPRIFSRCHDNWKSAPHAQVIPLADNFRSHKAILDFVNALFDGLMRRDIGGVDYDEEARLRFGDPAGRAHLASANGPPPVELHLRRKGRDNGNGEDDENVSDAELEARMVGRRLQELKKLKNQGAPETRWGDMVILLRSPRHKVEAYVREFARLGIPLEAARGGFYESLEVRDLISLLKVLDNPLQDLPLLGVLRSPLAGLTADELALIRIGREHGRFWTALLHWHKTTEARGAHFDKVTEFLRRYDDWRRLSRQSAVSHCLECVLDRTHYSDWLAAQERGAQKRANVERLLQLTRQFDAYDGESLYRFLKFVEAQEESEIAIEPAALPASDAVRLMTIHQSKGLEFPIVAVADLGKRFNLSDLSAKIILDEEFGLCPQIQPPDTPQFYPSLPHWLAQRRQKRKSLGEEMRLLYVALTRAARRLILAGTATEKSLEEKWPAQPETVAARSYLDWIGPWLVRSDANAALLQTTIYDENDPRLAPPRAEAPAAPESKPEQWTISPEQEARLSWQYPFQAATKQPAKTTVTTLRRQIAGEDEESFPLFAASLPLAASEIGLAHHAFLQWVSLDKAGSEAGLREEAARLGREKVLTQEQINSLDFAALAAFWQSETGRQLLGQAARIERELPFTARFSGTDLQRLGCADVAGIGDAEFVIVQGVADLVAILPDEIWLADFKTDRFPPGELEEKIRIYRPQVELYALALERIHRRPVTKRWLHFLALRRTAAL